MDKKLKSTRIICFVFCIILTFNLFGCQVFDEKEISYELGKVHISCAWWGNDARNEYTMDGIDIFRNRYPDINIKCKYGIWGSYTMRQNIYMKSHEQPDVMLINYNWLDEYSKDGEGFYNLYELAEYIDLSNFSKEALSYGEVNGKLNAIPIALNSQIIYHNKNIYDKYNLELPKTWDDYFEIAKVLRKDDIYAITMNNKSLFLFLIAYFEQTTGRRVCDENGEFALSKDDIKYMLEFYKRLIDEKVMMPIEKLTSKSFYQGKSAAVMRWASSAEEYFKDVIKNKNVEIVVGDYPIAEGASLMGWYIKPSTMYAVSRETVHPKEAAMLLNFLVNDVEMAKLQKTEKGIPLSKNATSVIDESVMSGVEGMANKKIIENQKNMSNMPYVLENDEIYNSFQIEADYYLYNKDTLENVAEKIFKEINK